MGKTRYTLFRYQIWRIIIGEERPQKGGLKKERTFVLLNTHTGLKHTNTTSAFSLTASLSLETIIPATVL